MQAKTFLSFWSNSGPVSGRKVIHFAHRIIIPSQLQKLLFTDEYWIFQANLLCKCNWLFSGDLVLLKKRQYVVEHGTLCIVKTDDTVSDDEIQINTDVRDSLGVNTGDMIRYEHHRLVVKRGSNYPPPLQKMDSRIRNWYILGTSLEVFNRSC